jgi:hypothetical protein
MVSAFAATVSDPLIQEAIALQGQEEARHARLLEYMIRHYDIQVSDRPAAILPANSRDEPGERSQTDPGAQLSVALW